ncbi:MAG: hypothetical protein AABX85_00865 [Nanoarchaeota archaeon]
MEEVLPNAANGKFSFYSNEENQKKVIVILLVAIIFFVLVIIVVFLVIYIKSGDTSVVNTEDGTSSFSSIEQCSRETNLAPECVLIFRMGNGKDECLKLEGQIKDNCFALLALTSRDTSYCDFISDNNMREGCKLGPDLRDVGGINEN